VYVFADSVLLFLSCTCLCEWCLPYFASSSSWTVLVLWCNCKYSCGSVCM